MAISSAIKAFVSSPSYNVFGQMSIPEDVWNVVNSFDTMFQERFGETTNYPPFNIIKNNENSYIIEIAVSGFSQHELSIVKEDTKLRIVGEIDTSQQRSVQYLRQKLSKRSFKLEFFIGKFIEIQTAHLENGILSVHLNKIIPEELKPIKIAIETSSVPSLTSQPSTQSTPILLVENDPLVKTC